MIAEKPAGRPAARPLHLPARTPSPSRSSRRRGSSTGRTASPPTSRSPTAAPRASCCARAPPPAATRFYIKDGKLHYVHNYVGAQPARRLVTRPGATGRARAALRVRADRRAGPAHRKGAPGRLQLYVDGDLVADAEAPVTTPFVSTPGALTCGPNPGSPVTPDYTSPFRFTGTLHRTVDGRRERGADQRPGGRAPGPHGPPVGHQPRSHPPRSPRSLRRPRGRCPPGGSACRGRRSSTTAGGA